MPPTDSEANPQHRAFPPPKRLYPREPNYLQELPSVSLGSISEYTRGLHAKHRLCYVATRGMPVSDLTSAFQRCVSFPMFMHDAYFAMLFDTPLMHTCQSVRGDVRVHKHDGTHTCLVSTCLSLSQIRCRRPPRSSYRS